MSLLEHSTDLDLLDEAEQANHSPSTVTTALPTPLDYLTGPDQSPWPPPRIFAPAAPIIKDFDSFTDGTGTGSFDCLSEITTPGELCAHPLIERHVSQLDAEDHMQSIALWREDVHLELDVDVDEDPSAQPTLVSLEMEDDGADMKAAGATPMCKRPRSIASSDDGRKRIRVQGTSTSSPVEVLLHLDLMMIPPPRRPRTISAPPLFLGGSNALS